MEKKSNAKAVALDWGLWALKVGALLLVLYILFGVIFCLGMCDGHSMENTLHDGDLLFFQRIGYDPQYGDIVSFYPPDGDMLIKRVIGLPGDTIEIDAETGTVRRNGEVLAEPYLGSPTNLAGDMDGPVVVEDGHYFVMGDNRMNSRDSRLDIVGQVPRDAIVGRLFIKEDWKT